MKKGQKETKMGVSKKKKDQSGTKGHVGVSKVQIQFASSFTKLQPYHMFEHMNSTISPLPLYFFLMQKTHDYVHRDFS